MTDAERLRSIARDAYTFGYAMIENYRTLYEQAVDSDDPRFAGGFGKYRHYSEPFTPANTDIVTPNNDTPYSWGWFDLRAEPWVITVPAIDRFYILPFHDLYTVYAGYVSAATTGTGAGSYLLAGPSWSGGTPDGFDGVITSSTDFVGCLGRTAFTDGDVDELRRIQHSYSAVPLSEYQGTPAPAAEPVEWPVWDEASATGIRFFDYLDFLLTFAPPLPEDQDIRERLASVRINGRGTFHSADLTAEERDAFEQGLSDGIAHLDEVAAHASNSTGMFGTRQEMAGAYDHRNVGAKKGLYGLPPAIAWYGGWLVDSTGNHITGATDYTITFTADQLPKQGSSGQQPSTRSPNDCSARTTSTATRSATAHPASTTATTGPSPCMFNTSNRATPTTQPIGFPHRKAPSPSSSAPTAATPQSPKEPTHSRRSPPARVQQPNTHCPRNAASSTEHEGDPTTDRSPA